jgi:hypothetical protein
MIDHLINFFFKLTVTARLTLLLPFVFVGIIYLIKIYIHRPVIKMVLYFLAVLFLLRVCLFYNPVSWATYKKVLPLNSIDWRHYDILKFETDKYLKPEKNLKYLAVGSSQTTEIYKQYARQSENFAIFAFAGLSPLDLYTYRDEIVRRKPEYILLYESEFDLARRPELASSKWSPFSLADIFELQSIIDTTRYFAKEDKAIIPEIFFGSYFPEFRYSFVYKDLTNNLLNKNKLLNIIPPTQIQDSIYLPIHLKSLAELSDQYISFNMYYLKKAIQYLNKKNIRAIIVEGQYNPIAYKTKNLELNTKTRALLQEFISNNPSNVFLTREEVPNFRIEDYRDGYHVKTDAGLRFSEMLFKKLDSRAL